MVLEYKNVIKGVIFGTFIACLAVLCLSQTTSSTCTTQACEREAKEMLNKIDTSNNVCENFFNFSCGKYTPEIPDHKSKIDELELIQDILQERLNTVMSEKIYSNDIDPIKAVKVLYQNCLDVEMIEKLGLIPIQEQLDGMGSWPVTQKSWNASWSWQQMVLDLENFGFSQGYVFEWGMSGDSKNSTSRILEIDQPSLGISREYLVNGLDDKLVKAYHDFQVDLAVIYGADRKAAETEMREALDFEITLAKISQSRESRRNRSSLYNPTTVEEFQKIFPSIDWLNFFNSFLPSDLQITKHEVIIISNTTVMKNVHNLLKSTPKRIIANFMMWRASLSRSDFLTKKVRSRLLDYYKITIGKKEFAPRWKECVAQTSRLLPIATSALYVRNFFSEESKQTAVEMVDSIKNEFVKILSTIEWMDSTTKLAALKKVAKMEQHIGYPSELGDDSKIIEVYKGLDVEKGQFLKSVSNINSFRLRMEVKKFRKPINKTDWETHSDVAIANAYYNWLENSILIPSGILQGRFFSADRPRYMNFASIGLVIGHEITHGFDDQGSQFDADGNLSEWWERDTKEAYLKKAQCIIEQYGNFSDPQTGLNLNGINTQGENIADNGGALVAYQAYQKWVEANGEEPKLPGLDYTPNQLFWISMAQAWCSAIRYEESKQRITTGVHSLARFRILGPMSNLKQFADDFNCPEGSPMNPLQKCKVW